MYDLPRGTEVSRMVPPRDSYARLGSVPGRAPGAADSHSPPSLVVEREFEREKNWSAPQK